MDINWCLQILAGVLAMLPGLAGIVLILILAYGGLSLILMLVAAPLALLDWLRGDVKARGASERGGERSCSPHQGGEAGGPRRKRRPAAAPGARSGVRPTADGDEPATGD
ncbi:hypothetical protein [Paludisphaera mucosa]|uniref:Uncharacterized protein n=1 Tax=Paludisphaera mucosa TaxID=3030827 RepID=A0ABT6FBI2_9BACT|nr:hypothetical protein [Paludisphaera mucosa]MDG3004910.1 hypothetical protein [Paludisphaera mucosa]